MAGAAAQRARAGVLGGSDIPASLNPKTRCNDVTSPQNEIYLDGPRPERRPLARASRCGDGATPGAPTLNRQNATLPTPRSRLPPPSPPPPWTKTRTTTFFSTVFLATFSTGYTAHVFDRYVLDQPRGRVGLNVTLRVALSAV
jgi:hypothetical protein